MINKKSNLPLLLAIAVAFGILVGSNFNYSGYSDSNYSEEAKLKKLIQYIKYDYVDSISTNDLLEGAINNIVGQLDPHSTYFTKEELARDNEQFQGNFKGIGVQFRMIQDTVVVLQVIKGGPSEKTDMQAGDRIISANGNTLVGIKSNDVVKQLKGPENTVVNVGIYRPLAKEEKTIEIQRGAVPIPSIIAYTMINDSLGYIKLNRFAGTSYDEFKFAIDSLLEKGMSRLVFDLRDNPGGYMNIANQICDEFLDDGKLIVYTKNNKNWIQEDFATSDGDFEKGQVYILINESSASASEIVAGAVQDNDRGTIIGRRSFGKGLVQQTKELGDGSAVRLTIARYYTPTGRSIQKPYELNESENYYQDIIDRSMNGELVNADSIKVNDSLKYITPKGKTVYGGGGIVPDVFVPIDTSYNHLNITTRKILDFSFEYVDTRRDELKDLDIEGYKSYIESDKNLVDNFLKEIESKQEISATDKEKLNDLLKTRIAGELFPDRKYYIYLLEDDAMIQKVLELEKEN